MVEVATPCAQKRPEDERRAMVANVVESSW